jgi:beta-lactamase class A
MEKTTRFLSACIIIVLLGLGAAWFYENYFDNDSASAQSSTSATKTPAKASSYRLDDTALGTGMQAIMAQNTDIDMSISVTDLQTGKKYHWGESASYTAASIGKLVTAAAYLHMVDAGQASLDDNVDGVSARTQLTKMIVESDNSAWEDLNGIVTHEGLQAYANSIGMASYIPDDNIMTSDDVALLLSKLAGQKLLTSQNTDLLLSLMKQASMRDYIVAAIPDNTDVYHKVGYLADRLHDAAIIKRGDRSYVLVIFSKSSGNYDFSRGSDIFGSITKATLSAFFKS